MADMKGITCCGDCIYYDWKKKLCKRGASQDDDPKAPFFADCPLPSVEPERPKGRWIQGGKVMADDVKVCILHCSECHDYCYNLEPNPRPNYCDNCGADMRGESE